MASSLHAAKMLVISMANSATENRHGSTSADADATVASEMQCF
jgi:hypothetical protein